MTSQEWMNWVGFLGGLVGLTAGLFTIIERVQRLKDRNKSKRPDVRPKLLTRLNPVSRGYQFYLSAQNLGGGVAEHVMLSWPKGVLRIPTEVSSGDFSQTDIYVGRLLPGERREWRIGLSQESRLMPGQSFQPNLTTPITASHKKNGVVVTEDFALTFVAE